MKPSGHGVAAVSVFDAGQLGLISKVEQKYSCLKSARYQYRGEPLLAGVLLFPERRSYHKPKRLGLRIVVLF